MSKLEISTKKLGLRILAEGPVAVIIALTLAVTVVWFICTSV